MKTFTDNADRQWVAVVNCGTLKRVRDATGVNLGDLRQIVDVVARLESDDLFVGEVAAALCAEQIEKAGIKPADFLGAMRGDAIGRAFEAVHAGVSDFFRDPATRDAVRRLLDTIASARTNRMGRVSAILTSSGSATSSPESSASTPIPTPSAS